MISLPVVDVLDSISIPVPCPVSWDAMHGDHRTRFCDKCNQNVHDVSELTRDEAAALVTGGEKLPCLRLFRRPDGRVMTADCLTRRERAWKWLHRRSAWAAALFALVFMGCTKLNDSPPGQVCMGEPPPSAAEVTAQAFILEHTERTTPTEHAPPASQAATAVRTEASTRHESDAAR